MKIGILAPDSYPKRVGNSDLLQGTLLAKRLEEFSQIACSVSAMPRTLVWPAVLGPQVAARAIHELGPQLDRAGLRSWRQSCHRRLAGAAAIPYLPRRFDAIVGHGLLPIWRLGRPGPAMVWGPGPLPEDCPTARDLNRPHWQGELESLLVSRASRADGVFVTVADSEARWTLRTQSKAVVRRVPIFLPHLPVSTAPAPPIKTGGATLRVLFVGGEARRKSLPNVVRSCQVLVDRGVKLSLTVVSAMRDGYVDLSRPWITAMGHQPQQAVMTLMQANDILCVPSAWESFGAVYVEAMALGLAVVGPDLPIQRYNFGSAALLADPNNVDDIARALDELSDPKVRARHVEAGNVLYRREYAPDVVATAMVQLCQESTTNAA